jgi:hypothetical protein
MINPFAAGSIYKSDLWQFCHACKKHPLPPNCRSKQVPNTILPASTLRNLTSLQPVKIKCTSKIAGKIASTDWLLPYKENATRCSRDRPSFHTPRDYHGNPRTLLWRILIGYLSGCIWIQLHWEWLACRNNHRLKGYPFAKIVPNKLTKERCLLRFLL